MAATTSSGQSRQRRYSTALLVPARRRRPPWSGPHSPRPGVRPRRHRAARPPAPRRGGGSSRHAALLRTGLEICAAGHIPSLRDACILSDSSIGYERILIRYERILIGSPAMHAAVSSAPAVASSRQRGLWPLAVIASAHLMAVLDTTIMFVALPSVSARTWPDGCGPLLGGHRLHAVPGGPAAARRPPCRPAWREEHAAARRGRLRLRLGRGRRRGRRCHAHRGPCRAGGFGAVLVSSTKSLLSRSTPTGSSGPG